MAQGAGQGVSRIRLRGFNELQQCLDHMQHLFLGRGAAPDQGLFNLRRRIFGNGQGTAHHRADGRAPRLAKLEGRIHVALHEHLFDGDLCRLVSFHHLAQPFKDGAQALRKVLVNHAHAAAGDVHRAATLYLDHPVTRQTGTGINA